MLTYDLSARGSLPRYEYLYRCLRRDILSGVLLSGTRLPSKRAFAEHLGISVITVESAYAQLLAEGMIESRARRGYFAAARALPPPAVAAAASEDEPPRWRLDLRSGRQDAGFFPAGIWSRLTRRVLAECPSAPLGGVPHEGLYELREAIAAYLRGEKALSVEPNQIIIGAGSEFLYLLLAQLFSGAVIALEDPGYPKIREVYTASGAVCVPAALDAQGVSPASLESGGAAVLHISPSHQFPTGAVTPVPRRQALLELMGRRGGYIIEDDYASELGFAPLPLPTLSSIDRAGRVIYMNTFSQTISPGLRVSYLVLPRRLLGLWRERLGFYSCAVPSLEQHVLARFISGGYYSRHLSRLRKACRERRSAVISAFRAAEFAPRVEIYEPGAPLHFLMRVSTGLPDAELRRRAEALGLRLGFLSDCAFSPRPELEHVLLINYSSLDEKRLCEAVELLGRII